MNESIPKLLMSISLSVNHVPKDPILNNNPQYTNFSFSSVSKI